MTTAERLKNLAVIATKFMKAGAPPAPPMTPENFEAVKIKGGETMIEYSPNLEIGTPVMVSGGSGSTPAKDDTYTLENGVVFVVKDGKIESVTEDGKPKDEPKGDDDKGDEAKFSQEAFDKLASDYAELAERFGKLETQLQSYADQFAKMPTVDKLEQFETSLQSVGEVILELSAIPFNEPVQINPDAVQDKNEAFARVADKFGAKQS